MEHMPDYVTKRGGVNLLFRWVICSCGWSRIINQSTRVTFQGLDMLLRRQWYNHAYTSEEQAILRELGGDETDLW